MMGIASEYNTAYAASSSSAYLLDTWIHKPKNQFYIGFN